ARRGKAQAKVQSTKKATLCARPPRTLGPLRCSSPDAVGCQGAQRLPAATPVPAIDAVVPAPAEGPHAAAVFRASEPRARGRSVEQPHGEMKPAQLFAQPRFVDGALVVTSREVAPSRRSV